jgi:hypothetical protein
MSVSFDGIKTKTWEENPEWQTNLRGSDSTPLHGDLMVRKDGAKVQYILGYGNSQVVITPPPKTGRSPHGACWHHSDTLAYFARHVDSMWPMEKEG